MLPPPTQKGVENLWSAVVVGVVVVVVVEKEGVGEREEGEEKLDCLYGATVTSL